MLATKPATSPVIPPPTPIIKSDRLKFFDNSIFKKKFTLFRDLFFSLALKYRIKILYLFKYFFRAFLYLIGIFLSNINAIFFVLGHNNLIFLGKILRVFSQIII